MCSSDLPFLTDTDYFQKTSRVAAEDENTNLRVNRRLLIRSPWNAYKGALEELVGEAYRVVFWHEPLTPLSSVTVTSDKDLAYKTESNVGATVVTVPVALANTKTGVTVSVGHEASLN